MFLVLSYALLGSQFPGEHTLRLEAWIDQLDAELEPLKHFILPVSCTYQ
jgi:cob(I)alamin adenosyltransferase